MYYPNLLTLISVSVSNIVKLFIKGNQKISLVEFIIYTFRVMKTIFYFWPLFPVSIIFKFVRLIF